MLQPSLRLIGRLRARSVVRGYSLVLLLVLALAATSCVPVAMPAATTAPAATALPAALPTPASVAPATTGGLSSATPYGGISFSYPSALAEDAEGETVAAESGSDGPWWAAVPEHIEIELNGYVLPETLHAPRIFVYPAAEFAEVNEEAGKRITALQELLQTKPAGPEGQLPFLPLFNAGQQLNFGIEYLSFQNGEGVRFLTQFSQALMPINNHELIYTFQGLTSDGEYYVAAILPVSHGSLPANLESVPQSELEAMAENYQQYLDDTLASLSAEEEASFTPAPADLDTLVQSIAVQP